MSNWKHALYDPSVSRLAFDCEWNERGEVQCVAFAASAEKAYVFPFPERRATIVELLSSNIPKLAQNGQSDLYVLRRFNDIEVCNYADDTIVAWHSCYPELAGASQDKRRRGAKRTRKGLAFLASLFTTDAWWKDYEFESREEQMQLCGRDAALTFEIMDILDARIDELDVRAIYEHQMRLVPAVVAMQERGLRIDEEARVTALSELEKRAREVESEVAESVRALCEERRERISKPHLFWKRRTCACCRNGKAKREECWSCAGFERKPTKKMLAEWYELTGHEALIPCRACEARGQWEEFDANLNSDDQKKILLYDVLKLPKRYNNKRVSVDEESLKSLLAEVQA